MTPGRRADRHGVNLTIYLDRCNEAFTETLMHYHDKKMALDPKDRDVVIRAYYETGRIEGYLAALKDAGTITEKEEKELFNKYTKKHL